ncbi:MAG: hypothetical protein ACFFEV_08740 [Candidatus Thorarchaeota archaeon]
MEDMKINSKISYKRDRITHGYEPHRLLQMIQKMALEKEKKD